MKTIVVGVDGSEGGQHALQWAADEARVHGAKVTALHAWSIVDAGAGLPYSAPAVNVRLYGEHAQKLLEAAVDALPSNDVDVATQVVCGGTADALITAGQNADLLVVGSRGHGGFSQLLLGSVSHQVCQHAPCPVVIVPARAPGASEAGAQRIVVGVDGSTNAAAALRWAVDEAKARSAGLEVVHVWHVPSYLGTERLTAGIQFDPSWAEDAGKEVLATALGQIDKAGLTSPAHGRLIAGGTATELVAAAKGADLLVVGSRGHGGFMGLLLGSVSQQVTHHAPCPVIIVPPTPAVAVTP